MRKIEVAETTTIDVVIEAPVGNITNYPHGSWGRKLEGILCSSVSVGNKPK